MGHLSNTRGLSAEEKQDAKISILQKLKRIAPGYSATIKNMVDEDGNPVSDPEGIASLLRNYWGTIFAGGQVDLTKLQEWFNNIYGVRAQGGYDTGMHNVSPNAWFVRLKHVKLAVKNAKNTMAGPDGIPSMAYKYIFPHRPGFSTKPWCS